MARNNCKGHCSKDTKFKIMSPKHAYKMGFKYCTICEKSKKTGELRCPCCTTKFRTIPRSKKYTKLKTIS